MTARIGQSTQKTTPKIVQSLPRTSVQDTVDSFFVYCRARRLSAGTMDSYTRRVRAFAAWLTAEGVTDLEQVTPARIRTYLVELTDRGLDDDTIITFYRVMRAWLNFCVREELIPDSPMRKVRAPKMPTEILPAFTPEDVRQLLAACKTARDTALVMLMLDTGLRASEVVALTVGDVDKQTGAVQVKQGKGRKDRVVFLGAKTLRALLKYLQGRSDLAPTAPLWLTEKRREALTLSGLEKFCDCLEERSGVAHCHPHTFRRSFALWSLRAGMNVYALQRLMGHCDLTVLRRYLALVEQDLADTHRQHGAVYSML
jgi:site-specific recombinase XerD